MSAIAFRLIAPARVLSTLQPRQELRVLLLAERQRFLRLHHEHRVEQLLDLARASCPPRLGPARAVAGAWALLRAAGASTGRQRAM